MPPFFIGSLTFDLETLKIILIQNNIPWKMIEFHAPRAFRFFNESDKFAYLENFERPFLLEGQKGCWISESTTAPYMADYLSATPEHRLEPALRATVVVTPQECVEVISFERPEFKPMDS